MIRINGKQANVQYFPDGTLLLKEDVSADNKEAEITLQWNYEKNEELLTLYFLTRHLQSSGYENIVLNMPYIPNARQDRVKNAKDVFTLKYFAELINSLHFRRVQVLDAHSAVSLALIDRIWQVTPQKYIEQVIAKIEQESGKKPLMFYPDEGACKRYSGMFLLPYCFGIKTREWDTGEIKALSIVGETERICESDVLIVDDICSYGGTFLYAAKELVKWGAKNIDLFVSHCEESILNGKLYTCKEVRQIYTTDSIFRQKEDPRIKVLTENEEAYLGKEKL